MPHEILCLRPETDFTRVGVTPPSAFSITYAAPDDAALASRLAAAGALVIPAVGPKLDAALFDGSSVRLVQVTGAGVDRLDAAGMQALGIPVANVAGGSNAAVAEYVVGSALTLLRRFNWANAEIRAGRYREFRVRMMSDSLPGLEGLTLGVVGFGNIGQSVARACARLGAAIVFHDPVASEPTDFQASAMPLEALLATSDIVSLHVPLLPDTEHLVGDREIGAMKPGAVLINAARGGVVDEEALAGRLVSGHLAGAAVDVYTTEPPAPDNPLLALGGEAAARLLLTPHIAGVSRQSWARLFDAAWQNVVRVLIDGDPPLNRVY